MANGFSEYAVADKVIEEGIRVERGYSFCKSMVYAIQAITGEQTHVILETLVGKAEKLFVAHEIDITKPRHIIGWSGEVKKRDYIFYPGTKLYLGVYVGLRTYTGGYVNGKYVKGKFNRVSYSFKLPQTYVKMDAKEFDDIAVDGMLMDSSFNFDEPNLKRPATPTEKRKKQEEKRAIAKAKREAKVAAKKASKLP